MKMSIKMQPVILDAKKGLNYLMFHGDKKPLTHDFLSKTSKFWELDEAEERYLRIELKKMD